MADSFEEKIDLISKDISFMKGQNAEALPAIKDLLKQHDIRINKLEVSSGKVSSKVGLISGIIGALGVGLMEFFTVGKGHY